MEPGTRSNADRGDHACRYCDVLRPAQKVEQHAYSPVIVEFRDFAEHVRERTRDEADGLARLEARQDVVYHFTIATRHDLCHGRFRHGPGVPSVASNQALDAARAIDRAPGIAIAIKPDEQVARKQGDDDLICPTRMTPRPAKPRAETCKPLLCQTALSHPL